MMAIERMEAIGYKDATNIGGGIDLWVASGLPIEAS
jgi:rhodanese-related sulfurtransferase